MRRFIFGGAVLLLAVAGAEAQLFACKGENGQTRYASSAEDCGEGAPDISYSNPKKKKKTVKRAAAARAPGKLPNVSPRKQRELDRARGDILLYELKSEREVKSAVEKIIGKTPSENLRRRAMLQKRREEHARNITSIRQELARLGIDAADSGN